MMKILPVIAATLTLSAEALAPTTGAPALARADAVAYLGNVTVRPGYGFRNADDALSYGRGLCDRVESGQKYADVLSAIRSDLNTSDDYQASYLITQAVNELCPAMIWQLRNSAAGYRPSTSRP